jgi:hypothetical protein
MKKRRNCVSRQKGLCSAIRCRACPAR